MRFNFIAVLVFLLGTFALPLPNLEAGEKNLRFATMHLEPYGFLANKESRTGIFQKIHSAIAEKANFQFTDTVLPIKRMLKQIKLGVSDCGIILQTPLNKTLLDQVAEIRSKFKSIIVTRLGLKIKDAAGLSGYSLAIPRGSFDGYFISNSPTISKLYTNGYAQSSRLLKAGRVDAIAGSAVSIIYNLHQLAITKNDIGDVLVFDEKPLWLQCTKDRLSKNEIARLRKAANVLSKEGLFDRLLDVHLATRVD